jgi:hypothetical protein
MRNVKIYLLAKKIHRWFVLLILITGLSMMFTGICMYVSQFGILDPILVRYVHNKLSILFTIALSMMIITGFYLYIFPHLPVKTDTSHQQK